MSAMQRSAKRKALKVVPDLRTRGFKDPQFRKEFFKSASMVLLSIFGLIYLSSRPFVYYYGNDETFEEFLETKTDVLNAKKNIFILAYALPENNTIRYSSSEKSNEFQVVAAPRLAECALKFKKGEVAYALKVKITQNVLFDKAASSIEKEDYLIKKMCTHAGLRWRPPSDVRIVRKP